MGSEGPGVGVDILASVLSREAKTLGDRRGRFARLGSTKGPVCSSIDLRRFTSNCRAARELASGHLTPETNSSSPERPRDSRSVGSVPQSSSDKECEGEAGESVRNKVCLLGGACRKV